MLVYVCRLGNSLRIAGVPHLFFFSSRRRHTRLVSDWSSDVCSSDLQRPARLVSATYWGEDQSMYVRPLTGSSWTLVTFRAKRLTRVLNVEATLLTLMMLQIGRASCRERV